MKPANKASAVSMLTHPRPGVQVGVLSGLEVLIHKMADSAFQLRPRVWGTAAHTEACLLC